MDYLNAPLSKSIRKYHTFSSICGTFYLHQHHTDTISKQSKKHKEGKWEGALRQEKVIKESI